MFCIQTSVQSIWEDPVWNLQDISERMMAFYEKGKTLKCSVLSSLIKASFQTPLSLWISFSGSNDKVKSHGSFLIWLQIVFPAYFTHTPSPISSTPKFSPDLTFTFSCTWEPAVILTADLYVCSSLPLLPGISISIFCKSAILWAPNPHCIDSNSVCFVIP